MRVHYLKFPFSSSFAFSTFLRFLGELIFCDQQKNYISQTTPALPHMQSKWIEILVYDGRRKIRSHMLCFVLFSCIFVKVFLSIESLISSSSKVCMYILPKLYHAREHQRPNTHSQTKAEEKVIDDDGGWPWPSPSSRLMYSNRVSETK